MRRLRDFWSVTFIVELFILLLTAPILYFPNRFGEVATVLAVGLLVMSWIWRKATIGKWYQATPADWPIVLLAVIMLPISIWVVPEFLRDQYALPRAWVLIWNLQLFAVIVTHASQTRQIFVYALTLLVGSCLLFALIAPFGTNWIFKLPGSATVLTRLPTLMGALSREGGVGFHPNIIAGAMLYALPLMISISVAGRVRQRGIVRWLLLGATGYALLVFVLLQSRGGYIGLAVALTAMVALRYRWGRWLLGGGVLLLLFGLLLGGGGLLQILADNPTVETIGGITTLSDFRVEIWTKAIRVIGDYPFTGAGLGIFQQVVWLLYPLHAPRSFYFGHAHNFWLQSALDFGLPGLVAILAFYIAACAQLYGLRRGSTTLAVPGLVTGIFGSLVAQSVFSLTDALPLGTTANYMFWLLFALLFAAGNFSMKAPQTSSG